MSRLGCITLALALGCRSPADEVGGITCDADELLDGDRCVPVACGQGTWGNLDEGDDAVYVDADAPDGGDGSRDAPLQRIDQALAVAEADGQVLIAAGTYTDGLEITSGGVDLRGRCSALVTLDGGALDDTPILQVNSDADARSTLQGVTVTDSYWGVDVRRGTLRVAYASLVGNRELGAYASDKRGVGTTLILDHVEIAETQPGESGQGIGLVAEDDADVQMWDSVVRDNTAAGALLYGGTARIDRSEISGTALDAEGENGQGLIALGTTLTVRGLVLADNHSVGLQVQDATTDLEGVFIERTATNEAGLRGRGLNADNSKITVSNAWIEDCHEFGVSLTNGTSDLNTVTIVGTMPNGQGGYGEGIFVGDGTLYGQQLMLEDNTTQGLLSVEANLILTDVVILQTKGGTMPDLDGFSGIGGEGISILGGDLSLSQATIDASGTRGLLGLEASLELTDVTISRSALDETSEGRGLQVLLGTLTTHRLYIEDFGNVGLYLGGTDAVLQDTVVYGGNGGKLGVSLGIALLPSPYPAAIDSTPTTFTADDLHISGISGGGLYAEYANISISDATIECITPAENGAYGRGVELADRSTLTASDVDILTTYDVGLLVGDDSSVELNHVHISDTRRGPRTSLAFGAGVDHASLRGDLAIANTEGIGLYSGASDTLCSRCTVTDSVFAAVVQQGGSLALRDTTLSGVAEGDLGGGLGLAVITDDTLGPSVLTLADTTITDVLRSSIYLDGPGSYQITNSALSGGTGTDLSGAYPRGNVVFATSLPDLWNEATGHGLLLDHNQIQGATEAAIFLHDATATLQDNTYQDNALDLLQQACLDGLPPPEGWEDETSAVELCPTYASPISEFEFYLYLPALELEE